MTPRAAALSALLLITILAACRRRLNRRTPTSPRRNRHPSPRGPRSRASGLPTPSTTPPTGGAVEGAGTANVSELRPFTGGSDMITSLEAYRFKHRQGLQVASVEASRPARPWKSSRRRSTCRAAVRMPTRRLPSTASRPCIGASAAIGNHPVYLQVTALHEGRGYVLWFMTIEPPLAFERPGVPHHAGVVRLDGRRNGQRRRIVSRLPATDDDGGVEGRDVDTQARQARPGSATRGRSPAWPSRSVISSTTHRSGSFGTLTLAQDPRGRAIVSMARSAAARPARFEAWAYGSWCAPVYTEASASDGGPKLPRP